MSAYLASALQAILNAAIEVSDGDFGNIQLFDAQAGVLHMTVHHGFREDFLERYRIVDLGDNTSCSRACGTSSPVIIEDVLTDPSFTEHRSMALSYGYRSVISMPILGPHGAPLGVLSVHAREPENFWPIHELIPCALAAAKLLEAPEVG